MHYITFWAQFKDNFTLLKITLSSVRIREHVKIQEERQGSLYSVPVNSKKGAFSDLLSSVFLCTEGNLLIKICVVKGLHPREFFDCTIQKTTLLLLKTILDIAQKRKLLGQPYERSKHRILWTDEVSCRMVKRLREKPRQAVQKKITRISERTGDNPAYLCFCKL